MVMVMDLVVMIGGRKICIRTYSSLLDFAGRSLAGDEDETGDFGGWTWGRMSVV